MAREARAAGVTRIVAAAFHGETDPALAELVDEIDWMRVGQLGRLVSFFKKAAVTQAVMAGQIQPKNLFDLRPDVKTLLLLGRLKTRNAETLFGAVADELAKAGVELAPATTFLDGYLAEPTLLAGPTLDERQESDAKFGFQIAKEISRLDIGQTVVVKNGTVLAVEAFEGTNETMRRGGALGRKGATMVKVSKPGQDFRFDVPVIGAATLTTAAEAKISLIVVEANKTLLLERKSIAQLAEKHRVSVIGYEL